MVFGVAGPSQTQNAVANGDTRTISLIHAHTKETISATFRVNGSYDSATLEKLNWFLRDWRLDEPTRMDPHLFDIVWEAYRESGSREPIMVMSAYRSPQTNAMLRRRSRAVAEHSQHILGKAMDQHYLDVSMSRVREIGMKMQRGGVGYYPNANSPFVHLDAGSVRSWPRMGDSQLARLFPDGKTVHIPASGQPLARYEEARAEIAASGSAYVPVSSVGKSKSFFAALFGGGDDDDGAGAVAPARGGRRQLAQRGSSTGIQVASLNTDGGSSNSSASFFTQEAQRNSGAVAEKQLPAPSVRRGRAVPAPAAPAAPAADARAAPQIAVALAQIPIPVAAPVPVAETKPRVLPPEAVARPEAAATPAPAEPLDVGVALPLPPRRPNALLASLVAANVPLPPARPVALAALAPEPKAAAPDRIAGLIGTAVSTLPDVITRGTGPARPVPATALGYAATDPVAAPASAPRPVIVARPAAIMAALAKPVFAKAAVAPAKIDRGSFRSLTSDVFAAEAPASSVLGAAAPPLRSAMRSQTASLFADPMPGLVIRFGDGAGSLPTDKFLEIN